jgi:hypothetical protein
MVFQLQVGMLNRIIGLTSSFTTAALFVKSDLTRRFAMSGQNFILFGYYGFVKGWHISKFSVSLEKNKDTEPAYSCILEKSKDTEPAYPCIHKNGLWIRQWIRFKLTSSKP